MRDYVIVTDSASDLPKEILKEIDGLEVGVKRYTKTDSKIAVFGDMFMVEKESGKILEIKKGRPNESNRLYCGISSEKRDS